MAGGPDPSPTDFSDDSLNGWDFEIDQTRLPSHLLSDEGINQYGGFILPPDSDLGINQYGSSLHPNAGESLLMEDISVRSDNTRFEAVEIPQNQQQMMPLDSGKQQSIDAKKVKNTGGRPMITITKEEFQQCKGRTLVDVANELVVSESTLKRRLQPLTGYKTWSEFQRSQSFPGYVHGKERMEDEDKGAHICGLKRGKKYHSIFLRQ